MRAAVIVLSTALASYGQVNVLTANYDNNRTNSNLSETTLNPRSVTTTNFGKVGTFPVDGQIYAQPLYVSGVTVSGATHNVVYVATMHNSVYAIDADNPQSTQPLWRVRLGSSILSAVFNFTDILPEVGILGTPVIDPARNVIYLVSDTLQNGAPVFLLHALSLTDGSEQLNGPVQITASVTGTGGGSDGNGALALDPSFHLQRPGLGLANGQVYISFGSHADTGAWHGWLISYDASNLQRRTAILNTTPNGAGGSIWQAGRAPAIDERGDIYVVTGNGDYDGASSFGESLLRVSTSGGRARENVGLNIRDWFTPANWSDLNDQDNDFGSTGVILVPGTNLLLAGSKAGVLYGVSRDGMGHARPASSAGLQALQANQWGMFDLALWNIPGAPIVYISEPYNAIKAFPIVNGQVAAASTSQYAIPASFYVGLAVSANKETAGTGIVWLTTADDTASGGPGTLHALDAADLSNELWNSNMNADQDGLGRFAKFAAPTVANGKVYVPSFSNALVIYGLLGGQQSVSAPRITAVVNGASFVRGSVSPGEIVAIFGANLGLSSLTQAQFGSDGNLTTSLAGTQVLVNGVPAPMYYASATQVAAITPFTLSGTSATFQVLYNGQTSATVTVAVAAAAPGMFSSDGSGGGLGMFNADGSASNFDSLTAAGSVVTFYATGAGQLFPAIDDGSISNGPSYATPVLPISVLINGQPAQVLYAQAAPGMVAGMLEVAVQVPANALGYNLQVVLQAGDFLSPNFLWLDVQ